MLKKMNPTRTASWQNLKNHYKKIKNTYMKELFATDPERFRKFSIQFNDILVDYSENRITDETLQIFRKLAEEVDLRDAIEKVFVPPHRLPGHTAVRRARHPGGILWSASWNDLTKTVTLEKADEWA